MKKWGFLLLMMGCFSFILFYILSHSEDKVVIQPYESTDNGATYDQENTVGIQQIEISREQIYHGDLLLVNNEYPVYEGSIKTDVVNLSMHNELTEGYMLLDSESYLSKEIAGYFIEMIAHAKNDGYHNFAFTSGFRSFAEQQSLYEQMGSDRALPPGYSEHNLGLALDVG